MWGITVSGETAEKHVLQGKRSTYKRRAVHTLQSAAPYVRCMSANSTFEYSSYCLGKRFVSAEFQRDRCTCKLTFNALYRMTKAFRTLQCYVIAICLCAPPTPLCKFVALVANQPA
ncbi:hypothetical protein AVEN_159391-1 [Araneus ventricosus]|uniref:Uncharacterized protein n=1 Tax=Araneus ventricosus TaxID=182803 RepID=A0A4Y2A1U8_ARAVE|nr:hypothetical protein AVEN_159391-1 [Araneus ventricosus]